MRPRPTRAMPSPLHCPRFPPLSARAPRVPRRRGPPHLQGAAVAARRLAPRATTTTCPALGASRPPGAPGPPMPPWSTPCACWPAAASAGRTWSRPRRACLRRSPPPRSSGPVRDLARGVGRGGLGRTLMGATRTTGRPRVTRTMRRATLSPPRRPARLLGCLSSPPPLLLQPSPPRARQASGGRACPGRRLLSHPGCQCQQQQHRKQTPLHPPSPRNFRARRPLRECPQPRPPVPRPCRPGKARQQRLRLREGFRVGSLKARRSRSRGPQWRLQRMR